MTGANVIIPLDVTDAMLVSCTVAEPAAGEVAWVSATTYAVGDRRYFAHNIYERLLPGAGTVTPDLDKLNWGLFQATARWAALDKVVGTSTNATGTLTYVFLPGESIGALYLAELVGSSAVVSMKDQPGGTVIYNKTQDLDGTIITSVFDWFFAPQVQKTDVLFLDLPAQFPSCELTVTVSSSAAVAIGVLKFGTLLELGFTQYGLRVGVTSYGRKAKDEYGNYSFKDLGTSRKADMSVEILKSDFNKIVRTLEKYSVTPCIYIGSTVEGLELTIVYGVYQDFYVVIESYGKFIATLQIEGLI